MRNNGEQAKGEDTPAVALVCPAGMVIKVRHLPLDTFIYLSPLDGLLFGVWVFFGFFLKCSQVNPGMYERKQALCQLSPAHKKHSLLKNYFSQAELKYYTGSKCC